MPDLLLVVASQGPFGPTPATCLAVVAVLLAPVAVAAIAARSVLSADPLPGWVLAVALAVAIGLAFLLMVTAGDSPGRGGLGRVWQLAAGGAVLVAPAVLLREGLKRGWFQRTGRRRRPAGRGGRTGGSGRGG